MNFENLPPIKFRGRGFTDVGLTMILGRTFQGCFGYMAPVHGAERSVRVLAAQPFPDSVPFPRLLSAAEVAKDLERLAREEARYGQPSKLAQQKGWEIGEAEIDGIPVVVALATWI